MREGSYDAAREILTRASPSLEILVDAAQGNRQRTMAKLSELEKTPADSVLSAMTYAYLGEDGKAVSALENFFTINQYQLIDIKLDPYWNRLHSQPAFATLLKRFGLDP